MKKRHINYLKNPGVDYIEEKGIGLSSRVNVEGAVLLENNGALPIAPCKVDLYGLGARKTIVRGIGSGDITYRYTVSIEQGLENAGFTITNKAWLDAFDKRYDEYWTNLLVDIEKEKNATQIDNLHVFYNRPHAIPVYEPIKEEAIDHSTETAIYVLSRKEGEGIDRRYVEWEYLPSREELLQLRQIRENYKNFILLLNVGAPIEMNEILEISPDAVLLIFQGGSEIGNATADLLTGKENPSGRLTSTWAKDYWDYPNAKEFGINDNDITNEFYKEGIYIGYRYFDTFGVQPLYHFGYGMSYTDFLFEYKGIECKNTTVTVKMIVTNVGDYAGKAVVQLYVSLPGKTVDQAKKQLCAFEKTTLLSPGEAELVKLQFNFEDLASFRNEDGVYVLEQGEYLLSQGNSIGKTQVISVIKLDEEVVTKTVEHLFERPTIFDVLEAKTRPANLIKTKKLDIIHIDPRAIPIEENIVYSKNHDNFFAGRIDPADVNHGNGADIYYELPERISLPMVKRGEYTLEQMIATMDEDELVHLVTGQEYIDPRYLIKSVSSHIIGACGETTNYFEKTNKWRKIPFAVMADGPAGLRLIQRVQVDSNDNFIFINPLMAYEDGQFVPEKEYSDEYTDCYQYVTGFPIATAQASTWNKKLMFELGKHVGQEMEKFSIDLWLAPGMNLHRNPLCGRAFEYYSEDPFLSGLMAASVVNGVQSTEGHGATIKHMAACNQEAGRTSHNSIVDERTMRDLYLKNFEIAVKYSNPYAVMTCLNCVNGPHGTNSRDIATHTLRNEWNYKGLIMTDWNTTTPERGASTTECINSGNDLIMPGMEIDMIKLKLALHNQSGVGPAVTLGDLQFCAKNVLNYLLKIVE